MAIGDSFANASLLPPAATAFLCENLACLDRKSIVGCSDLLEKENPGWRRLYFRTTKRRGDVPNWELMVADDPLLFLHLLMHDSEENNGLVDFAMNYQHADGIYESIYASGRLLDLAHKWGFIFDPRFPFASKLRKAAVEEADRPVVSKQYIRSIATFTLDLPNESSFLPHILGAMLGTVHTPHRYLNKVDRNSYRARLSEWAQEYVAQTRLLRDIFGDDTAQRRTRAAALAVYMLHSKVRDNDGLKLILDLYDESDAVWLLPAIGYGLFDRLINRESLAIDVFGTLLERSAHNFFARSALDPLILAWQETPGFPVTKSDQPELWQ